MQKITNKQSHPEDEENNSGYRSFPTIPLEKFLPQQNPSVKRHINNLSFKRLPLNVYKIPILVLLISGILLLANISPLRNNPLLHLYKYFSSTLYVSSSLSSTTTTTTTTITTTTMTTTVNSSLSVCPYSPPPPPPTQISPPPPPPPTTSLPSLISTPTKTETQDLTSMPFLISTLTRTEMQDSTSMPSLISTPTKTEMQDSTSMPILKKDCDISRGEWVRDPDAPYYTNTTCSMIQEHQNCLKFGRPNTDFLKWRWKPQDCELPRFDPVHFLELMRGKSMAFIGDSLARNHMQSLMCLLSRVEIPKDISDPKEEAIYKRMFYTNHNFTLSIFWSPFLVKGEEGAKGAYDSTFWNLHLDEADWRWLSRMDMFDYAIISAGNWFNRPSMFYRKRRLIGCLYCQNKRVKHMSMQYSNLMAFRTALRAINKKTNFTGTLMLRTLSPSHFEKGTWNKGGDCVRQRPFKSNEARMDKKERELYKAQVEEFKKAKREGKRREMRFRVLDTSEAMVMRPDGHPSRYGHWPNANVTLYNDCVHWCLPGPVDMWNDFLLYMLS